MPGKKEDRDLIDHFFGIEALTGQGIGRRHDLGRQVIGRGARRDLAPPDPRSAG